MHNHVCKIDCCTVVYTGRKYAKLCKKEGVQSDRINMERKSNDEHQDPSEIVKAPKKDIKSKRKFDDPFEIAQRAAAAKKLERDQKEADISKTKVDIQQAKSVRSKKTKELNKRTKNGQPVMKYRINNILDKLISERKS